MRKRIFLWVSSRYVAQFNLWEVIMLNEVTISRAILEAYFKKLDSCLDLDVAIVGGGPSGLVAGYYLATRPESGAFRTQAFDRRRHWGRRHDVQFHRGAGSRQEIAG
jgi:hypothetical protein